MTCILVITDDRQLGDPLVLELLDLGYNVTLARTGRIALQQAMNHKFDLIVLDADLPMLDSVSLAFVLREDAVYYGVPVIGLLADDETRDQLAAAGVERFFPKSYDLVELREAIREELDTATDRDRSWSPNLTIAFSRR